MTGRDWLSVSLRTSGVVLAIYYVWHLSMVAGMFVAGAVKEGFPDPGTVRQFVLYAAGAAVPLAIALVLVKWGGRLAGGFADGDSGTSGETSPERPRELFHVALKVIGVVCLTQALARLLMNIGPISALARSLEGAGWSRLWVQQLAWPVVLLVVGACLFFDGRWVVRAAFGRAHPAAAPADAAPWTPQTVFALALRIFGVVLLAPKLPWLVSVLIIRVLPITAEASQNVFGAEARFNWGDFLAGLVILAVGVYFMTGAKHLVRLVFRAGQPGEEPA